MTEKQLRDLTIEIHKMPTYEERRERLKEAAEANHLDEAQLQVDIMKMFDDNDNIVDEHFKHGV